MHQLLTELSLERLGTLYGSLPAEAVAALDGPIAKALNSRPSSIARRPEALKVKGLRSFLVKNRDEDVAAEILRAYLLGPRLELVTDFLDATGVEHEQGQVEGDAEPDPKQVEKAVDGLLEKFGADDVLLYLQVASRQWNENEGIAEALERLQAEA